MYKYGAEWIGSDIAEKIFDAVTACQCIWYPDHNILAPKIAGMLKPQGKFLILYMGWLPFESPIAAKGEELILKYNPKWTGYGDTRKPVWIPEQYNKYF